MSESDLYTLSDDFGSLEKGGFLKQFEIWVRSLKEAGLPQSNRKSFNGNLKLILGDIIDQQLVATSAVSSVQKERTSHTAKSSVHTKTELLGYPAMEREIREPRIQTTMSSVQKSPQQSIYRSPKQKIEESFNRSNREMPSGSYSSLRKLKNKSSFLIPPDDIEEFKTFSDFCWLKGAATFNRQKRVMGTVPNLSPGPAYYSPKAENLRAQSPSARIPISGKRIEFARGSGPGPGSYYPRYYCRARPK